MTPNQTFTANQTKKKTQDGPGIRGTDAGKHPKLPCRAKKETARGNKGMLPAKLSWLCPNSCT